jgi:two-component system chemotaxis response regulator CheY
MQGRAYAPATSAVDEPHLRELMRVSLDRDYEFAEAADTAEAIALADRVRPDLVLLDVMMPGGSGLALIERLRSTPGLATVPVVVVSAFVTDGDRRAAREAGADGFIEKPFDPDELASVVEELLAANR